MDRIKIYLADDDKEDREFLLEALDEIPLRTQVTQFNNGVDLMDKLFSDEVLPDVIFLDLYMPIMDGFECLTDIRNFAKFANIHVIVYSTTYRQREVNQLKEDGANQFIQKSTSFKTLKTLIHKSLCNTSLSNELKKDNEFIILK
ncbi:response regulator [uncultured Maribacter sp.]|uniref:response regulator n=1 Tax=uncultured Maribacter sp. TaxID=431308 RepID=UPI0030ED57A8|tara:strand:+ start:161565 stop:161999 length:435 start_codon:yes stop_codon:yes gene_type:complete